MDKAHKRTDKKLSTIEKSIAKKYRAKNKYNDLYNKFLAEFEKKDIEKLKALKKGFITDNEYKLWRKQQLITGQKYIKFQNDCANAIVEINKIAQQYVNQETIGIYIDNAQWITTKLSKDAGINFNLLSKEAINRLIKGNDELLPAPSKKILRLIDEGKAIKWNKKQIQRQLIVGLEKGESVKDISKRFEFIADMNKKQAIRNARTSVTNAENAGRIDVLHNAQNLGIEAQKEWIATLDERTRESHALMNGELANIDDVFSNGLMYPADPNGEPAEVYNCRCTLGYKLRGV